MYLYAKEHDLMDWHLNPNKANVTVEERLTMANALDLNVAETAKTNENSTTKS